MGYLYGIIVLLLYAFIFIFKKRNKNPIVNVYNLKFEKGLWNVVYSFAAVARGANLSSKSF